MKLRKELTDEILKKTKSKPEQLLKWFKGLNREWNYPSFHSLYLKKYSLGNSITNYQKGISIHWEYSVEDLFEIWEWARENKRNFNNAIKQFKEMYDL